MQGDGLPSGPIHTAHRHGSRSRSARSRSTTSSSTSPTRRSIPSWMAPPATSAVTFRAARSPPRSPTSRVTSCSTTSRSGRTSRWSFRSESGGASSRNQTSPRCASTPLTDTSLTRLPRNQTEGHIPRMALTTGQYDPLECLLRKIGIQDTEFTPEAGMGRVNFFSGVGGTTGYAPALNGGMAFSKVTPFWDSVDSLKKYDLHPHGLRRPGEPQRQERRRSRRGSSLQRAGGPHVHVALGTFSGWSTERPPCRRWPVGITSRTSPTRSPLCSTRRSPRQWLSPTGS